MSPNRKAFLDMIAFSEGTSTVKGSDNGYNVLVGGKLFTGYSDHPRKLIQLNDNLKSSAAGRYQLLARYYDDYKSLLGLKDFSPDSQDAIAIQQIKECRALPDVDSGKFSDAVDKCKHIWASLPGAGYGQRENKLSYLQSVYENSGGQVA